MLELLKKRIVIWITTSFVGYHRWEDAPNEVAFLRNWHRHVFHVKLAVEVYHGDREQEFFLLKSRVNQYIQKHLSGQHFSSSCEGIADDLLTAFGARWVEVSEDGENGAIVSDEVPVATFDNV